MLKLCTTIGDHQLTQYKLELNSDQNESTILSLLDECFFNRDIKNLAIILSSKKKLLEQINLIILHKQSYLTFAKLIEINKNQLIEIHKDINPKDEMNFTNEELQIQRQVHSDKIIINLNQYQLELQKQQKLYYKILKVSPYLCVNCCSRHKQIFESICGHSYCRDCHLKLNQYCQQKCSIAFCLSVLKVGKENQQMLEIQISKQERPPIIKNNIQSTANDVTKKVKCHICGIENDFISDFQNCYLCQELICYQNTNECFCFPIEKMEPQFQVKNANNKYKISDSQCQTCGNASNNIIKVYQGQCDHYFCMYCIASNKDCKVCYPNQVTKTEEKRIEILRPLKTVIEEQFYSET